MGIAFWVVCGAAAFGASRLIPAGRGPWFAEALAAAIVALAAGLAATALDFGGWNEPDWRAGTFAIFCAFAATGCVRIVRLATRSLA